MNRTHSFALALALAVAGCSGNHVSVSCSKDGDCDDGIFCNGTETCDTKTHKCTSASPPPCSDNVNCTTDLCDELSKGCVHIADSNQCTAGQTCDVKGDCVPACDPAACTTTCTGAGYAQGYCGGTAFCQCTPPTPPPINTLTGHAFLFGHTAGDAAHDHSGIAVGLAGTSITAMTAADGSYSLMNVPAGVYTITASHDKYLPGNAPGVYVGTAMPAPPDITLNHGHFAGQMSLPTANGVDAFFAVGGIYTADASHVAVVLVGENVVSGFTVFQYFALPTSLAAAPVVVFSLSMFVKGPAPAAAIADSHPNIVLSNDHVVYMGDLANSGTAVFSRPLDDSTPPVVLASAPLPSPGSTQNNQGSVAIIGTAGKYTIIETQDTKQPSLQYSWKAVLTDGSGSAINLWPPASTPTTAGDQPVYFYNDDSVVVFGTHDSASTGTITMHSFNLTTSVDTNVTLNNSHGPFTAVSADAITPDHTYVLGDVSENGLPHSFILKVGTTSVSYTSTVAPSNALNAGTNADALEDSTGFFFADSSGDIGGYWFFGTTVAPAAGNPVPIVGKTNVGGGQNPTRAGKVVYYTDNLDGKLKIASIPGTGATVVGGVLSASPSPAPLGAEAEHEVAADNGSANIVWMNTDAKLQGVTVNFPMTAAPTPVNLGSGALSNDCVNQIDNNNAFANGFYYSCPDTGALTGFTAPLSNNPIAVDTGVSGGLGPLVSSRRAGYLKNDGTYWTASGASKAMLTRYGQGVKFMTNIDPWFFFHDPTGQMSRVSNVTGTVIDEPLTSCDIMNSLEATLAISRAAAAEVSPSSLSPKEAGGPVKLTDSVLAAGTSCGLNNFNPYAVPLTNLP